MPETTIITLRTLLPTSQILYRHSQRPVSSTFTHYHVNRFNVCCLRPLDLPTATMHQLRMIDSFSIASPWPMFGVCQKLSVRLSVKYSVSLAVYPTDFRAIPHTAAEAMEGDGILWRTRLPQRRVTKSRRGWPMGVLGGDCRIIMTLCIMTVFTSIGLFSLSYRPGQTPNQRWEYYRVFVVSLPTRAQTYSQLESGLYLPDH